MTEKIEISTDRTTAISLLDSDSILIIDRNIRVETQKTALVATGDATSRSIHVNGILSSATGYTAIFGDSSTSDAKSVMVISDTGSILGAQNGVSIRGGGFQLTNHGTIEARDTAVTIAGPHAKLANLGTISSSAGTGVSVTANETTIVNNGLIDARREAVNITGSGVNFTNNGTLTSSDSAALQAGGKNAILTNNGRIVSDYFALIAFGNSATVTNNETVTSKFGSAIMARADDAIVTNAGIVTAAKDGITVAADDATVTNNGIIRASGYGVVISDDRAIVTNNKTILSHGGIMITGDDDTVGNYGTIKGTDKTQPTIDFSEAGGASLHNSGAIKSYGVAVEGGAGVQSIFNSGTIRGSINLGAGNDYFDGTGGTVSGTVSGGKGDDVYVVSNTTARLVETADGGKDLVKSTVSFTLAAQFENLTLNGAAKINATGNASANQLHGNSGDNTIAGKAGADTIWSHGGADILIGGTGSDQFVFATGDGADKIKDFAASGTSHDVLDLTGLPTIFNFNNLSAHHMTQVGHDVLIDASNGDSILLKNVKIGALDAGDFLF